MNEEYRQACFGSVGPVPVGDVAGWGCMGGQKTEKPPRKNGEESTVRDMVIRKAVDGEEASYDGIEQAEYLRKLRLD
jgi:hypothetical protein